VLREIAVIAEGGELVTPCGACRQRIFEFGGRVVPVWAADPGGFRRRFTADELLPFAFGPDAMDEAAETKPAGAA
jgi:cytidine deaminase